MVPSREFLESAAMCLYEQCEYPAVRYCILTKLLGKKAPEELYRAFLYSDIVEELYQTQNADGGWGPLESKDYTVKAKFPTSAVAISRCLYIGLGKDDRDILFMAKEYLEGFLLGTAKEKIRPTNERVIPSRKALVCNLLEAIEPNNPLCDQTYYEWLYIAERAFEGGEYSYERERAAQHEVFGTREDRLVPMQVSLLLKRRENIPPELEEAMLRHYGGHANERGHFWDKTPGKLPDSFYYEKPRRWMYTFNYINMFRGSALFLSGAVDWLISNRSEDGLWDWGPQVKDPWGYFNYFSKNRKYKFNRKVDCTMEILSLIKQYIDNNS